MAQNTGTLVTAAIRPNDSMDPIASAFASEIKGGLHTVETINDRDNIISERREWGMLCYVIGDDKTYQLKYGHDTTVIMNNNNWVEYSSSGGGGGLITVTYAQLQAAISAGTVNAGSLYKITDRGDEGLYFMGLSNTTLDFENGTRDMLVPYTYRTGNLNGYDWLGIWNVGLTPSVGDLVIWGGHVWQNVSGTVSASVDQFTLDTTEWTLLPKSSSAYKVKTLGCNYDFDNDWIAYCWDEYGNKYGLDYTIGTLQFGLTQSATNYCDWVVDFDIGMALLDNECYYLCNNIGFVYGNKIKGAIYSNINPEYIYNNTGDLEDITVYITNNTNTGDISENTNRGEIGDNSNTGSISYNSNNGGIRNNSNNGDITNNSNNGYISYNSNTDGIYGNNLDVDEITGNSNNGVIGYNSNTGAISNNSNLGNIENNYINVTNITGNSNKGTISTNSNSSSIENNSNSGDIQSNSNTGSIAFNQNNGYISHLTSTTQNVQYNTNNGNIEFDFAGDITDPVVNKYSSGGGGGGLITVTYAQLQADILAGVITPGSMYKITDRGDEGLYFMGLSNTTLDFENGTRDMLVPLTYQAVNISGDDWLGIWNSGLTPSAGNFAIWGGHVWKNLYGNLGAPVDKFTLNSEWTLVPKSIGAYKIKTLGCNYDFENDWIAYCWDENGNKFGIDYTYNFNEFFLTQSATNYCDWVADLGAGVASFGNECYYLCNNTTLVYNNIIKGAIYNNSSGWIYNNSNLGDIFNNSNLGDIHSNSNTGVIGYNNSNSSHIYNNSNNGSIVNNSNLGYIFNNSNLGDVGSNSNTGDIQDNSNTGEIVGNNTNVTNITGNSNTGYISNNSNTGYISYNSNTGYISNNQISVTNITGNSNAMSITNNSNTGYISNNSNTGEISNNQISVTNITGNSNRGGGGGFAIFGGRIYGNENTGQIANNSNTGEITNNQISVTDITGNTNNGRVYNNSNDGAIYNNSNLDDIYDNSNQGNISNNSNQGSISSNTNSSSINNNSNLEKIHGNSNTGQIANNSNAGSIIANSNTGEISNNSNAGSIIANSNSGEITNNSNLGLISSNKNSSIYSNSNSAGIIGNENTGYITFNRNNGYIMGLTSITQDVQMNTNNGNIEVSVAGNITDPVVNK